MGLKPISPPTPSCGAAPGEGGGIQPLPPCPAQTIQIMTGFMHIGFGIVLTTLTNVYTSVFVIGEIPFLGGVSFIISGCLSIGAEKSPTECAVKGSQAMNVISAIFALLGIVAFIVDLNLNGLYRSGFDYYSYLVLVSRGVPQLPHLGAIQPPGDPLPPFVPEPWGLFPGPPGEPRAGAAHPVGSGTLEVPGSICAP
uniref:Membrane spanning 4-domains A12 n=1 Tax=Anas platyrhynchos platyrhynchos TaxID=8840 RepID=A0A493TJI2_ANAPP